MYSCHIPKGTCFFYFSEFLLAFRDLNIEILAILSQIMVAVIFHFLILRQIVWNGDGNWSYQAIAFADLFFIVQNHNKYKYIQIKSILLYYLV